MVSRPVAKVRLSFDAGRARRALPNRFYWSATNKGWKASIQGSIRAFACGESDQLRNGAGFGREASAGSSLPENGFRSDRDRANNRRSCTGERLGAAADN